MKAPLSWLKDYVDIDCSPEQLKDKLFSCGFEVEEMVYVAKHIDRIVTCEIKSIEKHPDADKLSVTKVDAGEYGTLQIITAATNIFVGAIVPVALNNSTLMNGEKIKSGKLRGLISEGMFCSGEELGINDDWYDGASVNGILIFHEKYAPGTDVKKILDLEDVMFDINVTANRPDCQSILGIAREISAVLGTPLKMPDLSFQADPDVSTINTVRVTDKAFDLCPRYISHYVSNVKIGKSPLWLRRRLSRMGFRSINNIVDITNFVLLETGQPMHAFDIDDVSGKSVVIRRADKDEKIITLDGKEFTLDGNNLVICDESKPIALAGIMGGMNSEIKPDTKSILLESAKFARDNIRKTSKFFGQRTDASSRYEKGVDAFTAEIGMNRALNLIYKLGAGKIASDRYDLSEDKLVEKTINTKVSLVNSVLGIDVPSVRIKSILESLMFKVSLNGDDLTVTVPLFREDVESYQDIAEEVIREYGYDHLQPTLLKNSSVTAGGKTADQKRIDGLKDLMVGYGFNEMISYSFVSEKEYDLFGIPKEIDGKKIIRLMNPLGEDLAVMRTSLLPSAVRAACYNINRKNYAGRLFEFAKIYKPASEDENLLPEEENVLSFVLFGAGEDYLTAKGIVEGIFNTFGENVSPEFRPCQSGCMHPTRSAEVFVKGVSVGYFGQINPKVTAALDVDKPVIAGEIFYNKAAKYFNSRIVSKAVSKYPIVERDLAVTVDERVPCAEIMACIKKAAGKILDSLTLFDVYKGDQVEKGKKSMAFNLIYVSGDRTLTVEEIDANTEKILKALEKEFNAVLR